ncbi:hypothetical protein L9F63_009556 [Diploptera punctata]|uniref:Phosphatidylinositol-glycan biosynthesis class F protein n=1 Tax=Diploptera punctata TaxID=6984 RepID=A0AAD8ERW3_DIPPU|nr:hypothetical protein L9F63_009556 [Diploptera punctata]
MMLLSSNEDNKLVTFYSGFTCIYFPIVLGLLYVSDNLYNVGKYSFSPIIVLIAILECAKYVIGAYYVCKRSAIGGRQDERYVIGSTRKSNTKSKIKEVIKCFMIMTMMVAIYFMVIVLFGAEIFSKHEETLMLSVLMCVLTVFPICLNLGANSVLSLLFGPKPVNDTLWSSLLKNVQITVFGVWLGAFVIPLDWDRPWQEWPIPCSSGALFGYTAANIYTLVSMVPKLIKKESSKPSRKQR